jgi:superfamily II DNA or RNA helicase
VDFEIEGSRARAQIHGKEGETHRVGLDWSRVGDRILHGFCQCQRFAEGRPCKHLWAALVAFAEREPDLQPAGKDRLSLRKDSAGSWKDLGVPPSEGPRREGEASPRQEGGRSAKRSGRARRGRERLAPGADRASRSSGPPWRHQLATVAREVEGQIATRRRAEVGSREASTDESGFGDLRLLINVPASLGAGGLVLDVFELRGGASGRPGKLKRASLSAEQLEELLRAASLPEGGPGPGVPAAADGVGGPDSPSDGSPLSQQPVVVTAMTPAPAARSGRSRAGRSPGRAYEPRIERFRVPASLYQPTLAELCHRELVSWWDGRTLGERPVVEWDGSLPWRLALRLEVTGAGSSRLGGFLERNGQRLPLSALVEVLPRVGDDDADPGRPQECLILLFDRLARFEIVPARDLPWIALLREAGEVAIPREDFGEALKTLLELPELPRLETPEGLELSEAREALRPRLVLEPDRSPAWTNPPLVAEVFFDYGDMELSARDHRPAVVDIEKGRFLRRDLEGEHQALVRLLELGLRPGTTGQGNVLELAPRDLPAVAEPLLSEGWGVEVHGRSLRPAGPPSLRIESGIDWFELSGRVDFDGDPVEMKRLLAAVARGERFVELADGSQGLLPASWMETYDSLAKLAHDSSEEGLRFLPSQALMVDALLAALPPADVDQSFAELRQKLVSFDRIKAKKEPRGFVGELRGYQRAGLGWLEFLREFGLGGVLADDMGLGKTIQVLALLQACRAPSRSTGLPSLVVAPRSLIYNWMDEAARFTPKLKVVQYHGPDREALRPELGKYDLVVTTYGTMRRDIGFLATLEFDTAILDEAQAIKNAASESAKAARLLVARHRLALTGTPVENHLGELGSLFEYLNPGLLGRLPALDALSGGRAPSEQELALVARGMRPFILRRTKAQVLPDLPPKTEQVLSCELSDRQRELYDTLRAGYQASLLEQVETQGMGRSTIQVLEALLRLRQVACHPGLVNPEWEEAGSAKLDALFDQVDEVLDEGHKVIVFSQFTKLLAFVRRRLDRDEVPYAYLDGQTRKRGEVVERFQTDPACNVFLISLKAGGVGLNLTAAGYVFLLDPWWNPAVEAQAIDRAHRIGQQQPVFAYRMIAQDTVEQKMLELQRSKRELAEAILDGDGKALAELTAEDLRMLLS